MAKIQKQGIKTEAEIISAGGAVSDLPNDSQIYVTANSINKTLDDAIIDGDIGSSGGTTGYIVGKDSEFEQTGHGWSTYADAAGTVPVDGTGGTPNIAIARTTTSSEVLKGVASLKLTKDAANRQGEGFSISKSIGQGDLGKPGRLSFDYKVLSGTFTYGSLSSTSDLMVFIYDVANSQLVTPFPNYLDGSGKFTGFFQFNSGSSAQNYRVIIHVATASASSYDVSFDNFELRSNSSMFLSSNSDWQSYTPTFTNLGSPTNVNMFFRKNGPMLDIIGSFFPSATPAAAASVSLPLGYSASSSYNATSNEIVGQVGHAGGTSQGSVLVARNGTVFGFTVQGQNNLTFANSSALFAPSYKVSVRASIRIDGFSTGFTTNDTVLQNVPVVFRAYKSGGSISSNTTIPTWTSVEKDSVGAFNSSTGEYTVKIPGDYYFAATIGSTAANSGTTYISKNGTIMILGSNESSDNRDAVSGVLPNLVVGDIITLKHGAAATLESNTYASTFMCHKIESPFASVNIPKVATLKDVKTSGTQGGTFTSGSYQTRTLNTEDDPFNIVSLASNQFTLQAGTYFIEANAVSGVVDGNKTKIRNVTDSTDAIIGSNQYQTSSSGVAANSFVYGFISITSAKTFELQHRCQTTKATDGFGAALSFGDSEIYATVKITKIL